MRRRQPRIMPGRPIATSPRRSKKGLGPKRPAASRLAPCWRPARRSRHLPRRPSSRGRRTCTARWRKSSRLPMRRLREARESDRLTQRPGRGGGPYFQRIYVHFPPKRAASH
jgi:hypothetical protein